MRFDPLALAIRLRRVGAVLPRCIAALALVAFVFTSRAWAFDDMTYNFVVEAPDAIRGGSKGGLIQWLMVKSASVPGVFRIGWFWNDDNKNQGASIHAFVMLLDKPHTARQLLDANIKDVSTDHEFSGGKGKRPVVVYRKGKFKIVKQGVFKLGNYEGFQFEVVAPGTGAAIPADTSSFPKAAIVPTRQRWVAVVRGEQVITLLFTCPDANFPKYASTFAKVEKSLKVR